jgi:AraC family transcriptional regulator
MRNIHSPIDPAERLRDIELSGLSLTEFKQPANLNVSRHAHESATVLFMLKGFAADRIAGRVHECNPSSVLIRPAGELHTHHYGRRGAHCLVIEVRPPRIASIRSSSRVLDCPMNFNDGLLSALAMRLYMESRIMDSASPLAIEGLVLEMLAQATRRSSKTKAFATEPLWLKHAVGFIHENYAHPVSLSQIAAVVGVHAAHLAEVFRKHYGCSVGQHIRRLRLDYAAREVMLSENSLAEISVAAGFYDQSHFTKFFKRHTGIAPAKMRALARTSKAHTKSLQLSKLD